MDKNELIENRATLVREAKELLDLAKTENRELTDEEYTTWEAKHNEAESLAKGITIAERQEEAEKAEFKRSFQVPKVVAKKTSNDLAAFNAWVRGDVLEEQCRNISITGNHCDIQLRDDTVLGDPSEGGDFAPDKMWPVDFVQQLKDYAGVRQVARHLLTPNGNTLPFPVVADTAEDAAIVEQGVERDLDVVTTTNVDLSVYVYTSKIIKVPVELVEDSAFDVFSWIQPALIDRLGRGSNAALTTGTGSSQPQGVVNFTTGKTAASQTSITFGEIIDLEASLDSAYHDGAAFMMNSQTWGAIKQLTDNGGHILYRQGVQDGAQKTLDGYPVILNSAMPDIGTDNKPVVFANFAKGYVVRDVRGIRLTRFNEKYMDQGCYGVLAEIRTGGVIVDARAGRVLQNADAPTTTGAPTSD